MAKTGNDAHNNNDAAAIAEQFTRDGVFVTTEGPITGRQAIQKWYTDLFQWWHPKNHIDKLDGNVVHLIGTAGNELADPQTTQKILALMKAANEAQTNNDPAARVALYTRDAVFVTPDGGPIIGRQAIQKWFTDLYQWWHPKNSIHKVDGDAPHLIGTAGNELWATGEYRETGQGKTGEPLPIKGHWLCIFVREGDEWKIRVAAWYTHPDSVMLINKSFAPQPAATPSPTASPSAQ